ncbi:MAG: ABC transporter permease [Candidatus Acidiferrales bacterium]
MEAIWQDLRYALRTLAKEPGFTIVAILTLALGIGANTAIFSLIDSVLLNPLPYKEQARLISISAGDREGGTTGIPVSFTKFQALQQQSKTLESTSAFYQTTMNMTGSGEPQTINANRVNADFFHTLGVAPVMGRDFLQAEDQIGGANVAILSNGFWRGEFNSDPNVLGKTLVLDGNATTIVGVMPRSFDFPFQQPQPDVWLPRVFDILGLRPEQLRMGAGFLSLIVRLKAGQTMAEAQAEADAISENYAKAYPGNADAAKHSLDMTSLTDNLVGAVRPSLFVLLGAVGFVLLIACANVASLLLTRATAREKEMSIRQSLGATRARLTRQLLTEGLVLAFAGGLVGVVVAAVTMPLLRAGAGNKVPRLDEIHLNGFVLLASFALCVVTGVVFGLAPAVQVADRDLHDTLKEGRATTAGGSARARQAMVIAEVAVALLLVTGAGLLIRSFLNLMHVNPGFDSHGVTTFPVSLPTTKYATLPQRAEFFRQALEKIETIPSVESAGAVTYMPMTGTARYVFFCPEGRVCEGIGKDPIISMKAVSEGYFAAMRIPLLRGRVFTKADIDGAPQVVIINQTVAEKYFPGQDPVGKTLQNSRDKIPLQIVGVVADAKINSLSAPKFEEMYRPYIQAPWMVMTFVVRSNGAQQPLVAAVREQIRSIDPDLPVSDVQSLDHLVSDSVGQPRLLTALVGAFAVFALVLAAIGIYGVMAFSVSHRMREMGIRMALGAAPGDIVRLVVGQGMRLVFAGIVIGFVASLWLTKFLASQLFGTQPKDPATFALVALGLALVALAACLIPARRAMRVDPMVALRYE